jgi:hypothetical protein
MLRRGPARVRAAARAEFAGLSRSGSRYFSASVVLVYEAVPTRAPAADYPCLMGGRTVARIERRTDGNGGCTPETAGPLPRGTRPPARRAQVGGRNGGAAPVLPTTEDLERRVAELEVANAALRAETERQRLIIDGVIEYPIFALDPGGVSLAGTPVPSAPSATRRRRCSGLRRKPPNAARGDALRLAREVDLPLESTRTGPLA